MKIEFDLPEFDKELKVEITIRKDGEVVYSSSSSTPNKIDVPEKKGTKDVQKEPKKKAVEGKVSGNLMNMEF